ncbi:MAG: tetratricopeptide repeat protein [Flavobacteriaceae bacterium]|nr:tetratricopeptide repeat protein [Flavobacteriaceae bacterium]
MNERLAHILKQPFSVKTSDIFLLEDELEKYPYFQPLHLLKLKALATGDQQIFLESLPKTSVYCTNRSILYHFIHTNLQPDQSQSIPNEWEHEKEISPDDLQPENAENDVEINVNSSLQTIDSTVDNEENTPNIELDEISKSTQKEDYYEDQIKHFIEHQTSEYHSFSEWLKINTKQQSPKDTSESSEEVINEKFRVIEEFLDKNPKITPSRDYKPQTNIAGDLEENMSHLMTETLAKIYVEQKKYDKAIKAFSILRLKYPEKSGYFADRIREIKELKHN